MKDEVMDGITADMYGAYVKSGGNENDDTRTAFTLGMEAALMFFDHMKETVEEPEECALAFVRFRKEIKKAYLKEVKNLKLKPGKEQS